MRALSCCNRWHKDFSDVGKRGGEGCTFATSLWFLLSIQLPQRTSASFNHHGAADRRALRDRLGKGRAALRSLLSASPSIYSLLCCSRLPSGNCNCFWAVNTTS